MSAETFTTSDLHRLQKQVYAWRRRQTGRVRLPEGLWRAATELARSEGPSRVARTLRLDYYKLRERVAPRSPAVVVTSSGGAEASSVRCRPEFVEVKLAQVPEVGGGESVVELCEGGAARMTLWVRGDSATLVALAESYWRRAR